LGQLLGQVLRLVELLGAVDTGEQVGQPGPGGDVGRGQVGPPVCRAGGGGAGGRAGVRGHRSILAHRGLRGRGVSHSRRNTTGVGRATVRDTEQSQSRERATASGSRSRAASPPAPSGKRTRKVTSTDARWLPCSSRTLSPAATRSIC